MSQDFAAILRAAIIKSGKSQYALAKETGVSQGRISDFLSGKSLRLEHASQLAHAVGLVLSSRRPRTDRPQPQLGRAMRWFEQHRQDWLANELRHSHHAKMEKKLIVEFHVPVAQCPPDWNGSINIGWRETGDSSHPWAAWWASPHANPFPPNGGLDDALLGTWIARPDQSILCRDKHDLEVDVERTASVVTARLYRRAQP